MGGAVADRGYDVTVTNQEVVEYWKTEAALKEISDNLDAEKDAKPLVPEPKDQVDEGDQKQSEEGDDGLGGLDDDEDEELTLISCDEENPAKFSISRKAALMCNLVKNIIEGDKTAKEIEIKKVNGPTLDLVQQYLKHHDGEVPAEIKKPIQSSDMTKIAKKWDVEFINKEKAVVFQLILAANYMDIKSLLHLGCAKIATLIKGKSPEEIKKILEDDTRRRLLEAMMNSKSF